MITNASLVGRAIAAKDQWQAEMTKRKTDECLRVIRRVLGKDYARRAVIEDGAVSVCGLTVADWRSSNYYQGDKLVFTRPDGKTHDVVSLAGFGALLERVYKDLTV